MGHPAIMVFHSCNTPCREGEIAESASDLEASLFELAMSDEAQPLMDAVQKHIADNVEPIQEEFTALHAEKEDRWSWHPRQMELLEGAKNKAKEAGTNKKAFPFPLPNVSPS